MPARHVLHQKHRLDGIDIGLVALNKYFPVGTGKETKHLAQIPCRHRRPRPVVQRSYGVLSYVLPIILEILAACVAAVTPSDQPPSTGIPCSDSLKFLPTMAKCCVLRNALAVAKLTVPTDCIGPAHSFDRAHHVLVRPNNMPPSYPTKGVGASWRFMSHECPAAGPSTWHIGGWHASPSVKDAVEQGVTVLLSLGYGISKAPWYSASKMVLSRQSPAQVDEFSQQRLVRTQLDEK